MFDVGFTELLLIGVVSLVVIGPERLPDVARTLGRWVSKMQRFVRGVKSDINAELETGDLKKLIGDQREQISELRSMVNSTRKEIETSTRHVVGNARKRLDEMEETVKTADDGSAARSEASADDGSATSEPGKGRSRQALTPRAADGIDADAADKLIANPERGIDSSGDKPSATTKDDRVARDAQAGSGVKEVIPDDVSDKPFASGKDRSDDTSSSAGSGS